ncbi:MAG: C-terminal binding protein [Spirochaetota bacterium]
MPRKVVTAGDRVYLKFFDLEYFQRRASEADAEIVACRELEDGRYTACLEDADALIVIDRPVSRRHLEAMKRCRIVLALEVGYDFIDVEAATERGIPVCNVPAYCTGQVAVHALTLLLACHQRLKIMMGETAAGGWDYKTAAPVPDLAGSTLGIVGLGRIGRALASRARGLGVDITAYDPYLSDDLFALAGVRRCYELDELLGAADLVSLHVPLTGETFHMIGERELGLMKPGAVLVNTCRGKVVDTAALLQALRKGRLGGVGLDVLESEPPGPGHPLLNLPNAVVTPHAAWYSERTTQRLKEQGMDEVVRVLNGKRPRYIVNPEVLGRTRQGR